jgi:hypothetical protein
VVEVGGDLRPLRLDCAPCQAPVGHDVLAEDVEAGVAVGQVHPLVVLGYAGRQVPGVDQTPDEVAIQCLALGRAGGREQGSGVPVVEGGEDHSSTQPGGGVTDVDVPERRWQHDGRL